MHGEPHRTTTWRSAALGVAACASLILSGCGGAAPEVTLPADRVESAGLCYGATMALTQEKVGKGSGPLDAASHALHFALLAGTAGELADPAQVTATIGRIRTHAKEMQDQPVPYKKEDTPPPP